MGRLDLPDVRRDEDVALTCDVCQRWNRGTAVMFGHFVCGSARCLAAAKARMRLAFALRSDDPALD